MSSAVLAIHVCVVGPESGPVLFAADELVRYLKQATGREVMLGAEGGLTVGLMEAVPGVTAPEVADARMDDAIFIDVTGERGVIAGNNPRSVLLAVYRYLTEVGCRWVRPGGGR